MRRGDVVIVSAPGDFGKPRPAVIVQADAFNETHASITVCLITTSLADAPLFRIDVEPSEATGLRRRSQIMVDKLVTLRRDRLSEPVGRIASETQVRLTRSLAVWLGIGG